MSGSFWKFSNGFTSLSNISTILENHSINQESGGDDDEHTSSNRTVLLKLLDENDLHQELLSNHSLLLEFLRDDDVIGQLVDLVISENNNSLDDDINNNLSSLDINELEKDSDKKEDKEEAPEEKEEKAEKEEKDDKDEEDAEDQTEEDDDEEEEEDEDYESPEEKRSRHATLAAEILSADVWSLTDTVMESTENLNKLWAILDSEQPLSINLSTYFMKIMEHLLDMKCEEMITYLIDNQPNLVKKFTNHLSNPPLMDFLLKLISTDKQDNATGIIDFLQNQNLITYLVDSLDISNDNEDDQDNLLVRQSSAADFLKALITISANSTTDNSTIGPNELTRELVSYEQMDRLCTIMLKGGYALANGVGIIIEIIRKNNSDYDILPVLYITLESHPPTGRDPIYLGHLLRVFGSKIDEFNKLLMNFDGKEAPVLKTPFGEIEPLGFERFKICELIAELLHCSNMALLNDNKGFDVVKERDALRLKMKEYDPISFKYNEVIVLPDNDYGESNSEELNSDKSANGDLGDDDFNGANDTIDSFNTRLQKDEDNSMIQHNENQDEEEEPHANANLSEEQIRANPVIGDFLKIALFDTQIISNILSMFFKFPWNNFLHNVVFDIVQQVLNGSMDIGFNKFLAIDLFHRGDITNKIIEGQRLCTEYEEEHNGLRLGYMGHLTLIAEEVVKFIQLYPVRSLSNLIDEKIEDDIWGNYVSHVLYDTREKYNAILGGGEEDEDEDEDDTTSRSFDEGTGEVIEKDLNSEIDRDIFGSSYEDNYKESDDDYHLERSEDLDHFDDDADDDDDDKKDDDEDLDDDHENSGKPSEIIKSSSSDESESDDDDHFTNYMSQQLTNTASTEIVSKKDSRGDLKNNHTHNEDNDSDEEYNQFQQMGEGQNGDNDDDYIDPNDDGLSYKKSKPLFDSKGTLIANQPEDENELSLDETSSSSSSDNEDEILFDEYDDDEGNEETNSSNKLTRAASKG